MTPDFRALCAELLAIIPASGTGSPHSLVVARARALLAEADGPAVPDGREPASVATQPSDAEVEKPAAWMCPAEPYWDGKEWRPRWQMTRNQELAEWWARPDKPTPLFAHALPTPEATND